MVNCAQLLFVFLISLGNFILVSKAKNLSMNVWTVNSSIEINNCKELNVDGIITDRYFIKA